MTGHELATTELIRPYRRVWIAHHNAEGRNSNVGTLERFEREREGATDIEREDCMEGENMGQYQRTSYETIEALSIG